MAVARKLHSPALLTSAHRAFVHGMDLAPLVSAGIALAGVVLTVAFLPQTNASKKPLGMETTCEGAANPPVSTGQAA